jgi:hypothetical protein
MDLTFGYLSQWEVIIFSLRFEASALKHLKLYDISHSILAQYWFWNFKDDFDLNNLIFQNIQGPRAGNALFIFQLRGIAPIVSRLISTTFSLSSCPT